MFTKLYLDSTDPTLDLYGFFNPCLLMKMFTSILFHTIVYVGFLNLVKYIFTGQILSKTINKRLVYCAILFMAFGYFARYLHVKEIYKSYNMNMIKSREHMDKLFISWIFIG